MLKMKALVKVGFVAVVLAVLSGCTSAPIEAPKTEKERIESKSLLSVPVDIAGFTYHKVKIEPREKNLVFNFEPMKTIFTNPENGKTYDFEGQPVNEKGYRILTDGYVCQPQKIVGSVLGGNAMGIYGERSIWSGDDSLAECRPHKLQAYIKDQNTLTPTRLATAALVGGAIVAASGAIVAGSVVGGVSAPSFWDSDVDKKSKTIEEIIEGDIDVLK
jgi:hypothetical protein